MDCDCLGAPSSGRVEVPEYTRVSAKG